MTDNNLWLWIGFNIFVLAMLALDLGVFHRKAHIVTVKESIARTVVWVVLAMLFNLGIAHSMGDAKGLEFFTGYVIEKSLSVDNVFVFALLFSYFAVPPIHQHKVLFWGHPRRADHARDHDRPGRGAHREIRVDHLRLRRVPHPHGRCSSRTRHGPSTRTSRSASSC